MFTVCPPVAFRLSYRHIDQSKTCQRVKETKVHDKGLWGINYYIGVIVNSAFLTDAPITKEAISCTFV